MRCRSMCCCANPCGNWRGKCKMNSKIKINTVGVSRFIHLLGGLRCGTSTNGKLQIHVLGTPLKPSNVIQMDITEQRHYVRFFRSVGLDMVGFEDISSDKGYTSSTWHAWDPDAKSIETDIDYIWSGIANAFRNAADYEGCELARNTVFGIRATSSRLRDISEAYGNQNTFAFCHNYQPNIRFKNLDTLDVFLAIHSFLVEMGILRDYLATFLAKKHFNILNVSRMAKLRERCATMNADPVAQRVVSICDKNSEGGWLGQLSDLRNLIVHSAPITSRTSIAAMTTHRCKIEDSSLPQVYLGITIPASEREIDALRHCLDLFRKICELARYVASISGIRPLPFRLTDNDLL
jgi:hypothetical protein